MKGGKGGGGCRNITHDIHRAQHPSIERRQRGAGKKNNQKNGAEFARDLTVPLLAWWSPVERLAEVSLFHGPGKERGEIVPVLPPGDAGQRVRPIELGDPPLHPDLYPRHPPPQPTEACFIHIYEVRTVGETKNEEKKAGS